MRSSSSEIACTSDGAQNLLVRPAPANSILHSADTVHGLDVCAAVEENARHARQPRLGSDEQGSHPALRERSVHTRTRENCTVASRCIAMRARRGEELHRHPFASKCFSRCRGTPMEPRGPATGRQSRHRLRQPPLRVSGPDRALGQPQPCCQARCRGPDTPRVGVRLRWRTTYFKRAKNELATHSAPFTVLPVLQQQRGEPATRPACPCVVRLSGPRETAHAAIGLK